MKKPQNADTHNELFAASPKEQSRLDALVLAAAFLQNVQAALDEKKMTRKSLAEAMGTSASWLTQMFRGDKLPNLENLAAMAKILDIDFHIAVKKNSEATKPVGLNVKRTPGKTHAVKRPLSV